MKPGKVAPRTIQFRDDVQIREIEANEEPPAEQSSRRGSWDPNLANVSDLSYKQHQILRSFF
jgi:hypothetical protein